MLNLQFEQTNTGPYPVTTTGDGTAITVCKPFNDPMVAFVTQTGFDDEVVYLSLGLDHEFRRHITPAGREVISGMGYNPITRQIWCSNTTSQTDEVFTFDPETGLETSGMDLSADGLPGYAHGMGTNGLLFIRSSGGTLELRMMNGNKLADKEYTGRNIQGASASPFSWTFIDSVNDEIVVIGPLGNIIATAPTPGTAGGSKAIAFNYVTDQNSSPQIIPEDGIIGPVGSPTHPDTPWNPVPWLGRHRLYIANDTDQTIYAGYLT